MPPAGQPYGWPENDAAAEAAAREPQGGSPTANTYYVPPPPFGVLIMFANVSTASL